ncbi:MAG: DMT family transporter [Ktedonobacterales bacterium]
MRLRDFGALLLLAAIFGGSFLFIRVAAPALGPVTLADVRVLVAGLALLLYGVLGVRKRMNLRAYWKRYLILGALNAALPYSLIGFAELRLTAGLAAILNATTPLFATVVAAFWLGDRITPAKLFGLLLGIIGVSVVVGWSPLALDGGVALAVAASLLAALAYALGGVYAKRTFVGVAPLAQATGQQLGAGIVLLPFAIPLTIGAAPTLHLSPDVIGAVVALALLGTALAYLIYFYLIVTVGATSTLSVTFLVPFFGLLWSALFLHEPVSVGSILGLLIILASIVLVTGLSLRPPTRRQRVALETAAPHQQ